MSETGNRLQDGLLTKVLNGDGRLKLCFSMDDDRQPHLQRCSDHANGSQIPIERQRNHSVREPDPFGKAGAQVAAFATAL